MKFLSMLFLLVTPFTHASMSPRTYEITATFGDNSFIDLLKITESISSAEPCGISKSSSKLVGSFTSPNRFTVPLDESSCVGNMNGTLQAGFELSIIVNEGQGDKNYEFIGHKIYQPWSGRAYISGDIMLDGATIGTFYSSDGISYELS